MYIIDTVPITKTPFLPSQTLSYFTSQPLKEGSLVLVPLKKRETLAIVLSRKEARKTKMEIKKAEFALKPILKVIEKKAILSPLQIKLAKWISNYYWSPLGKTIFLFLPNFFLNKIVKAGKKQDFSRKLALNKKNQKKRQKTLYIAPSGFLPRKEIKETIEKNQQVLFLIPEKQTKNFWQEKIEQKLKINSNNICFFSTGITQKKYIEFCKKINQGEIKIIIGARSALFAPFYNLGLIVVEKEESPNYKSEREPKYNARKIAEKLAKLWQAKLTLLSSFPLIETYYQAKKEGYEINKPSVSEPAPNIKIIDMKKLEKWQPISPILFDKIKENFSLSKKTLLFLNRKGNGTSLLCQDCGWIKKCPNCGTPLSYHIKNKKPLLWCHHCNFQTLTPKYCEKCKSWKLKVLGTGIEKIEYELKKELPNANILRLDKETAPNTLQQKRILKKFNSNGNILIATSLILQHFPLNKIPLTGIISIDALLSLPDFKSEEKGAAIIQKLLFQTSENLFLQTFWPNSKVFNFKEEKYSSFFKKTLNERNFFLYPPFSKIIKLTSFHKNPKSAKIEAYNLKKKLEFQLSNLYNKKNEIKETQETQAKTNLPVQILGPAPTFVPKSKQKYGWKILIKLNTKYPILNVKYYLLAITPQNWRIDVDPTNTL